MRKKLSDRPAAAAPVGPYIVAMQPLPQNDPADGDDQGGLRTRRWHTMLTVCGCACICITWVAVAVLWLAAVARDHESPVVPLKTVGGLACVGCGGTCRGGGDCEGCTCLMVPQRCVHNESDVACWEEASVRELSVVPAERALCGTFGGVAMGCGLV